MRWQGWTAGRPGTWTLDAERAAEPCSEPAGAESGDLSPAEVRWRQDNTMEAFKYAREEGPQASVALAERE
jgi:hypothetical protein